MTVRGNDVVDITSRQAPTVCDVFEVPESQKHVRSAPGKVLGRIEEIAADTLSGAAERPRLLAPCDLQALKACGVTFARSMVERVIEERAAGDPRVKQPFTFR